MAGDTKVNPLDDLTEEEIASLEDGETNEGDTDEVGNEGVDGAGGESASDAGDSEGSGDATDGGGKDTPTGDDGADPEDAGTTTKTGTENAGANAGADEGKSATTPAQKEIKIETPVFVSAASEQAVEQIAAIKAQKDMLADKFDDGELSARDYQKKLDTLNEQQRAIEWSVQKAELAAEMSEQGKVNQWMREVETFLNDEDATGGIYQRSQRAMEALDAEVREIGAREENISLPGRKILEMAHEKLSKEFGWSTSAKVEATNPDASEAAEKGKPVKVKHADPVPTLGRMPAAEDNNPGNSKFSALDKLEGEEYEEAFNKLSQSDRNAYLARG